LWLVVSEVPLERYGPEHLETALRDLDWVAQVAVAHESVVEHFARQPNAVIVPMTLFTMFSTEARAAREMEGRRKDIETVLKRVAGCEEWGVRVVRGPRPATPVAAPAVRSGAAFLTARKEVRDNARMALQIASGVAAAVFDELSPFAKDTRRRSDAPPGVVPPLLDAAFLVPSANRAGFRTAARRAAKACAEAGAEMTLTGPWPAYSFAEASRERV
jgi:hypothetical protein